MYELLAEQEIKHSAKNGMWFSSKVKIYRKKLIRCHSLSVTEFFKGNNWKIHPDWLVKNHYVMRFRNLT